MHTNNVNARALMADAKFFEAYSRYDEQLGRYETWNESVDRVMKTHKTFYKDKITPELLELFDEASDAYKDKTVLGAQRALQFGGDQLLKNHMRLYNCTSSYIDRDSVFGEIFWVLLAGAGCGFSVQKHHVAKLSKIQERKKTAKTFVVEDSVEGWADAASVLMSSFFVGGGTHPEYEGRKVYFDLSRIRPRGALISGGFKAPGPEPLRLALDKIEYLLQGRVLKGLTNIRPIDAYDIIMFIADAVLAGGVRRSATICLFSYDDEEMMNAKVGNWRADNPQRGRSNNSVVLVRSTITPEMFSNVFEKTKEFGEPGFAFFDSTEFNTNPCVTADTIVNTTKGLRRVDQLLNQPFEAIVNGQPYSSHVGFVQTGIKPVLKITTHRGNQLRVTDNHKILCLVDGEEQWIEAGNLSIGDKIVIGQNNSFQPKDRSQLDLGWLVGNVIGDGGHNPSKYPTYVRFWGETAKEQATRAADIINSQFPSERYPLSHTETNEIYTVASKRLTSLCQQFISDLDKDLLPNVFEQSDDFLAGLVQGYFDSDGTVFGSSRGQGIAVRLSNTNYERLQGIQLILNRFGIISSIYNINSPKLTELPNGKGGTSLYQCQQTYDIHFSRISLDNFVAMGGFGDRVKKARLEQLMSERIRAPYKNHTTTEVINIVSDGVEPVYDCRVEDVHRFEANGLIVHNCFEIGMYPVDIESKISGFQGCNLTEINGDKMSTEEKFYKACRAAAILGTIQAGYTTFKYLSEATKKIFEREALLGVSVTGWMNNPQVLFDENILRNGAKIVKDVNKHVAGLLGINPAARTTCTKPSGNASVLLSTASGIHGEPAPKYLRIVQMNKDQEVAQLIKRFNPYMVEESVWSQSRTDYSIAFPVVSPPNSIYNDQLLGVNLLEKVKLVQNVWVEEGTNVELCVDPRLRHNVSNTITVPNGGWQDVQSYIYDNRDFLVGVSFISESGDKDYPQAPFTSVLEPEQIVEKYGAGAIFGAGLVTDALKVFSNLWEATTIAQNPHSQCQESLDNQIDWIRRFDKFARNYFDSDVKKAEYCLKDLYIAHKWQKIQQNYKSIDFVNDLKEKKYTEIDTMGAVACVGANGCEITF